MGIADYTISIPRKAMTTEMERVYEPRQVEEKWYKCWLSGGYFHAEVDKEREPFCIVIPPPNITGFLHLGHALDNTLQDIIMRFRRMQGFNALWIPGTDHAGIATQVKVEGKLAEEGFSRYDIGREAFLERVWEWKDQYGGRIIEQLKRLGASCDWDRLRFTMDEGCSRAVREVFVSLYEKDLIYQGNYIINWCPRCHTALSDIEVEHEDTDGKLYHIKYPFEDSDGYMVVATTRPETMLGDTAVAVNPEDERYRNAVGKVLILPIVERRIPVIADDFVDPEFGTGAVKVTPAHDPNDFGMGQRHDLESVVVIDEDGTMNDNAGQYSGYDRYECRKAIVDELDSKGLLVKVTEHEHAVGHCQRCATVVEPLLSKQWFVRMQPLAEPALKAVYDGRVRFIPERFTKVYTNWLENIHDWCISRQLWWGHRIPVWYCKDCDNVLVSREDPDECSKCGSKHIEQDEDVLDTWFSSSLWPFSTLGWPDTTKELEHFYPTSVLITGYDIIFFWVARMIVMGLEFMHDVPFSEVYIHGLIRDEQGRKMSKSLGNTMDPIEIIDEVGADSLRFSLITGNTPGNDMKYYDEKIEGSRNFTNKLWNAARFALMNLEDYDPECSQLESKELADRWIMARCNGLIKEVTRLLESYELGEAARALYDFMWGELCDWYIELVKPRLYGKTTEESRHAAQATLHTVLRNAMRLLHPFMPFVTEEIWQHLSGGQTVMLSQWPVYDELYVDLSAEEDMNVIMNVTRSIRNIRSEMDVALGKKVKVICCTSADRAELLRVNASYIQDLAGVGELEIETELEDIPQKAVTKITDDVQIYMPLFGMIDMDKEITRLSKEIEQLDKELARVTSKLSNEGFLSKAPEAVVQKERNKRDELADKKRQVETRLTMLTS